MKGNAVRVGALRVGVYSLREGFRNFGDFLGPRVIEDLFSESVVAVDVGVSPRGPCLVSVGSIMHLAHSGDGVWGSGIRFSGERINPSGIDFYSVRGPLSAEVIRDNGGPSVQAFGDPGLLVSRLPQYQGLVANLASQATSDRSKPVLVIPHYAHTPCLPKRLRLAMRLQSASHSPARSWLGMRLGTSTCDEGPMRWISPFQSLDRIVHRIAESRLTISSSLHGLITACSFGTPFRWWWPDFNEVSGREDGRFKYRDFFASVDCRDVEPGSTIDECVRLGPQKLGRALSLDGIIQSMPDESQRRKYRFTGESA